MFFSIPYANFLHHGSRIRIKEFKYCNSKNCFSALGNMIQVVQCSSRIRILIFLPIPDPGVKTAPDPGSGTLVSGLNNFHPVSHYLGSAESPLCLLSPAENLFQKVLPLLHAVSKWNLLTNPLSLYGRRLCRTGTACCTSTTCQNVRGRRHFDPFSEKSQKPNSAHKCPITSIQVWIESQKLSEFSCITFRSLNRGCPPF